MRASVRLGFTSRLATTACVLACVLGGIAGCSDGGSSAEQTPSPPAASAPAPSPAPPPIAPEVAAGSAEQSHGAIHTDAEGRRWIDDVPLDVFFDDPLAIAGQTDRVAEPLAVSEAMPAPETVNPATTAAASPPTGASETSASGGGGSDWGTLITPTALDDEVTSIRNQLSQNLQTLGNYNLSYLTIPLDAATLATLAQVAQEHPGDISWKDKALQVRDLALRISEASEGRGRKAYDAARVPFEMLEVVLNGGNPAGLEEPTADLGYADVAAMSVLMKRIDRGSKWLKTNTGNEDSLKERQADAQREAAVLATMAVLLGKEGYGYAEDPEFLKMAHELRDAGLDMARAAGEGDFTAYDAGISRAFNSCTACHGEYRQ